MARCAGLLTLTRCIYKSSHIVATFIISASYVADVLPMRWRRAILKGSKRDESLMQQDTGPPVIIPEEGLQISPGMWQAVIVLACPVIAFIALAVPIIFAGAVFFTVLSWGLNYFFPLKYKPELMHQPPLDQSTPLISNNEST